MNQIRLTDDIKPNVTLVPNEFIDRHMVHADGEYVKIYLYLLRSRAEGTNLTIDEIADRLELTRKDVLRAVHYWEKAGLLTVEKPEPIPDKTIPFSLAQVPEKRNLGVAAIESTIRGTDMEQTIYMAETYLGRPLSSSELNSFCYINQSLRFSPELLEYLIDYCIERGKKSVRYMESVAINWYQQGISTVKMAKEQTARYTQNVFPVMKAFGLAGRNPGPAEIDYIRKWNALGFGTDIIVEACNRTLLSTHQASFPYANRILEDWKKAGVHNSEDIALLDRQHQTSGRESGSGRKGNASAAPKKERSGSNAFHNFEQRTYDYRDLEAKLTRSK